MDHVLGTLKNGRIVLDERPDWPEGQRVWVTPGLDDEPPGTVLPRVRLSDGSDVPINGTLEHSRLLAEQMGRPDLDPPTMEEWRSFAEALADADRLYGSALKRQAE
jgi:hypothetical protein